MDIPARKSARLRDYDYSQNGVYFITICTYNRSNIFELENGGDAPVQNQIIHDRLRETESRFDNVKIDKYVVMPNHVHAIVLLTGNRYTVSDIVCWFKSITTNDYISRVKEGHLKPFDKKLWQRSYHDHIIRNERDYRRIWQYIEENPIKWEYDCFYKD